MKKIWILVFVSLAVGAANLYTAPPSWWINPSAPVVDGSATVDNYAPANLGQLKHIAKRAMLHLDNNLNGGAGPEIAAIVDGFEPQQGVTYTQSELDDIIAANYAPINLGQLKYVAKRFYDRLQAAGYKPTENLISRGFPDMWNPPNSWTGHYPWNPATPKEENYAPANIGQLKMVFSFDLTGFDSDLDGLPDAWEEDVVNADPFDDIESIADVDPNGNFDGDSLTNLEELQLGLDPLNASDAMGRFEIVSGSEQTADPNQSTASSLVIEVLDYLDRPMAGKGVRVRVNDGQGLIRSAGSGSFVNRVELTTDSLGKVAVDCQASGKAGAATELLLEAPFAPSQQARFYTKGWLGIWSFDEGSGNTSADSSDFKRQALLNSSSWVPGMVKSAIQLTAVSKSIVEIEGSAATFDLGGGSFSGMAWIKTSQAGGARILGQGFYDDIPGFELEIGAGGAGRISLAIGQASGDNIRLTTTETFNDDVWHHVAFVIDRVTGTAGIYVDGTLRTVQVGNPPAGASTTSVTIPASMWSGKGETLVFGWALGSSDYFDGKLDEVRLHRGALTGPEIAAYSAAMVDSDTDGLPDGWEQQIVDADSGDAIDDPADVLPGDDFDGDGASNLDEYLAGTSPVDYYNGVEPFVTISSGNGQAGSSGVLLTNPLTVRVVDQYGKILNNAPLFVQPADPSAEVGTTSGVLSGTLKFRTSEPIRIFVKP